jgi:hypothetical protein
MSITIVPQSIKRLIRAKRCPNEQQLAAYAEQQLVGVERSNVERHFSSCDACLRQVAFLMRGESIQARHAPPDLVQAAIKIGTRNTPKIPSSWQWLAPATAAVAIIAFTFLGIHRGTRTPATPETSKSLTAASNPAMAKRQANTGGPTEGNELRGAQEPSDSVLLSPTADERVNASQLEFRWNAKDGAAFYEVEIVSEIGDVVWKQRTVASVLKIPASVHLEKDKSYYVWVRTHTVHGQVEQSKAVRFTIG